MHKATMAAANQTAFGSGLEPCTRCVTLRRVTLGPPTTHGHTTRDAGTLYKIRSATKSSGSKARSLSRSSVACSRSAIAGCVEALAGLAAGSRPLSPNPAWRAGDGPRPADRRGPSDASTAAARDLEPAARQARELEREGAGGRRSIARGPRRTPRTACATARRSPARARRRSPSSPTSPKCGPRRQRPSHARRRDRRRAGKRDRRRRPSAADTASV